MSFTRSVLYTVYCDSDRCFYMPRSRLNCWVPNQHEARNAAVKEGWLMKRDMAARCPKCKEREGK